ncbi:MAG: 23S rRNA (guanosine(2251)-2'-O)-methyltransferase RlmB [Candidatus Polarisedimenticolia bacterium]
MELLTGINAVEAALSQERRTVERVWVERGRDRARLTRIRELARRHGVPVEEVDRERLARLVGRDAGPARHQGVVASVSAVSYADPEDVLEGCGESAIVVVADGVEDPRNLGALVRTAAGAGVSAVFIPERRTSGLSATAARAAAGAVERVPVSRVGNVASFIKVLKEKGFWVIGLDADGDRTWDSVRYTGKTAFVIGGEGRGIRRLVREYCDVIVAIPLAPGTESLNLSVAAGICLFEVVRQRRAGG